MTTGSAPNAELPLIDEHVEEISAGVDKVWVALTESLDRGFAGPVAAAFARAVGCEPSVASGPRPLVEGGTIPGFRVIAALPEVELVLGGRHRFSSYVLTFRLEQLAPDLSRLRAESRAVFPGPFGSAYRLLVIGTRGHVIAVRRLLSGIRRASESRSALR